jgi:anaerobic magnesium-protoporphyrin IX monomethyl ester cyclase
MNKSQLDVLFINADSSLIAYQGLASKFSAIEPPTWSLLLAESCRSKGFSVAILDCTAEDLSHSEAVKRIIEINPRLALFVVYGQNPNSGTTNMIGNTQCCELLKSSKSSIRTGFVGSHTSALPKEVLSLPYVDFILQNEGVYALQNLLRSNLKDNLANIKGIGYKSLTGLHLTPPEIPVPQEKMDNDLPGYAWDLLPFKSKPFDLYRSHYWHAGYNEENRSPFAAIYTSLGCMFKCDFCMINIVNRVDNSDLIVASDSAKMRYWSTPFILKQLEILKNFGVSRVRLSDEMFFLNQRYFEPLLNGVVERDLDLHMWSYTRVDTVREKYLELFRNAGIEWLGIGIEAGSREIRREVSKGTFQVDDISSVTHLMQKYDINIGANYIFGFPDDNKESMQQTLDLALELNTEFANFYPCQALPGSALYRTAIQKGWELPTEYAGYAFLSYEAQPLPTKFLSAAEVVLFRDKAWQTYFTHEPYLQLVESKFGKQQRANVEELAKIKLRRRILGD